MKLGVWKSAVILIFLFVVSPAFATVPNCQPMGFNHVIEGKKIVIVIYVEKDGDKFNICDSLGPTGKIYDRKGLSLYVNELKEKIERSINKLYKWCQKSQIAVTKKDFLPSKVYFGGGMFSPITIPLNGNETTIAHEILHYLKISH